MSDHDDAPSAETPVQRALRLKQAALKARSGPPQKGGLKRDQSVTVKSGSNKPWMTR
ncbi:hypothetical protein [Brevundimonas sp. NPDC058933]|uniref:hypothetical protein n=1 Tax=Brevundimonas sp. NPDC058933 TaxID=3346673 RepID=UPI003BEF139E